MPVHYWLQCNSCNYGVNTTSAREYSKNKDGKRSILPHPACSSSEVHGESTLMYCSLCHKIVDIVLTEYNPPIKNYYEIYTKNCHTKVANHPVVCPTCHSDKLFVSIDNDTNVKCPRCNDGMLKVNPIGTLIS